MASIMAPFMSGTYGRFLSNQVAYVKQAIDGADSSGSYQITVTFTGSFS